MLRWPPTQSKKIVAWCQNWCKGRVVAHVPNGHGQLLHFRYISNFVLPNTHHFQDLFCSTDRAEHCWCSPNVHTSMENCAATSPVNAKLQYLVQPLWKAQCASVNGWKTQYKLLRGYSACCSDAAPLNRPGPILLTPVLSRMVLTIPISWTQPH